MQHRSQASKSISEAAMDVKRESLSEKSKPESTAKLPKLAVKLPEMLSGGKLDLNNDPADGSALSKATDKEFIDEMEEEEGEEESETGLTAKRKLSMKLKSSAKKQYRETAPDAEELGSLASPEDFEKLIAFLKNHDEWRNAGDSTEETALAETALSLGKHNDDRLEVCQQALLSNGLQLKNVKRFRLPLLVLFAAVLSPSQRTKTMNKAQLIKAITSSDGWKAHQIDSDKAAGPNEAEAMEPEQENEADVGDSTMAEGEGNEESSAMATAIQAQSFTVGSLPSSLDHSLAFVADVRGSEQPSDGNALAEICALEAAILSSMGGGLAVAEKSAVEAMDRMNNARKEVNACLVRLKEFDGVYRLAKKELDEWNSKLKLKKGSVAEKLAEVKQKAEECRSAWQLYVDLGEKFKTVPISQDELDKWQELCTECLHASKRYSTLRKELLEIKSGL